MDDLIISEEPRQDDFINMELKESGFIDTQEIGICCLITCIIEIIGNGLLLLVIIYEKFVQDPKKRTVINQLISQLCGWLILHNLIGAPLLTNAIIKNDVGKYVLKIEY